MLQLKGLAHVVVHACGQTRFAVAGHGIGRHGHNGQLTQVQPVADGVRGLQAIEHGHLHVHQHQVIGLWRVAQQIDRFLSVVGQLHHSPFARQQLLRHLLVDEVVFHHQQAHAIQAARASSQQVSGWCLPRGHSQCIGHRVIQHGAGHGFDQEAVQHLLLVVGGSVQHIAPAGRDHDHDGPRAVAKQFAQLAGQREAVHAGHVPVEEDHVELRWPVVDTMGHHGQCVFGAFGGKGLPAQTLQHTGHDLLGHQVVIHHQCLQVSQGAAVFGGKVSRHICGHPHGNAEVEGAALAHHAAELQLAPHQPHQPLADGQAQSGTTVFARGRALGLCEAGKYLGLCIGRNANAAVMHFKQQVNVLLAVLFAPGIEVHTQQHLTLRRELDGVATQVDEHLLQAQRIANEHLGNAVVNVKQQLQLLGFGVAGVDDTQVTNQLVEAERLGVQLHLAGFYL